MLRAMNEEAGFFSKSKRSKLQRLYREGKAAYSSVQKHQEASGLSKKKVVYIFYKKNSYTKFRQTIRHFKSLPDFAKRINEIWFLDVDNGVKYLLIYVDVSSRLVRVQSIKSKYVSDALAAFKKS